MKIKYKDLEIWFNQEIQKIESRIPANELDQVKKIKADEDEIIKNLSKTSPAQAILESWNKTEAVIYEKLRKLFHPDSLQFKRLTVEKSSTELLLSGVLSPYVENILQELEFFRNRVSHSPEQSVPNKVALKYYDLSKFIQSKVNSLTELPIVKLTPLTLMVNSINSLIDKGKYNDISIDDIENEIKKGTVLNYLKEKAGRDIDLSIILNSTTYPGFERFYIDNLKSFLEAYRGDERRKWGIENSGLCLLLAWTNEIIQQGSGWYPSEL